MVSRQAAASSGPRNQNCGCQPNLGIGPIGEPRADHTGVGQDFELAIGDVGRGQGDAPQALGLARQGVEQILIGIPLHDRMDDYPAFDAECVVHFEHVVEGRILHQQRRIGVIGETFAGPIEVKMSVRRARRRLEPGCLGVALRRR
jgi:hypothetical protein